MIQVGIFEYLAFVLISYDEFLISPIPYFKKSFFWEGANISSKKDVELLLISDPELDLKN